MPARKRGGRGSPAGRRPKRSTPRAFSPALAAECSPPSTRRTGGHCGSAAPACWRSRRRRAGSWPWAARIDERGRIAWQLEPEGDSPAERALLQRGVALLRRGGVLLCEAASGHELARLASGPPKLAAVAEDMSVALLDEDDVLSFHRLATHLSVV